MAKFSLKLTKRYLRDLKLARKRGMDESLLNEIIGKLLNDEPTPTSRLSHYRGQARTPTCSARRINRKLNERIDRQT